MYAYSGKWVWGVMYAAILYALMRTFGWRRGLIYALGVILVVALADQTCATVIRPWVERMRPSNLANPLSEHVHVVYGYRGGAFGFPSCHAANTIGAALFLSLTFARRRVWIFLMLWALISCYSRMYLGVHYPGDLLAGAIVGATWGITVWFLIRYLIRRLHLSNTPRPDSTESPHPAKRQPARRVSFAPCDLFIAIGLLTTIILALTS